jgi:ABC-type bacteriocin/lantibiotic exporter with double-glycine peptidase domain
VAGILPGFLNSSVSAHRIRELVQLPREIHREDDREIRELQEDGRLSVCMENVSFSYMEGTDVIRNSYLHASPGEIVALVGPSGEGKTTLIRLILGLVEPSSGRVFLRSSGGKETDMCADSRFLFTYVPQGNTIMSGSIAENMRIVNPDASDEDIIRSLKISCAWEFVRKLPGNINSQTGERGRGLSEGQAQRIAIARALLRNAPVLLLDEATSALDARTEGQVLKNIKEYCPDKTCIVTTHHAGVLDQCTRIYRVQELQITELTREEGARIIMDC